MTVELIKRKDRKEKKKEEADKEDKEYLVAAKRITWKEKDEEKKRRLINFIKNINGGSRSNNREEGKRERKGDKEVVVGVVDE